MTIASRPTSGNPSSAPRTQTLSREEYGSESGFVYVLAFLGALAVLFVGVGQASGAVIDTTTTWDGASFAAPTTFVPPLLLGEPDFGTIGQTFAVGADNVLDSFNFWLDDVGGVGEIVNFAAFVMAWDGAKATGSILFQSAAQATSDPTGRVMEQFAFNTGGLALTPGAQYVAFLSTSNFFDGIADAARIGSPNIDAYGGGELVALRNGSDFSKVTTFAWDKVNVSPTGQFTPGLDAAFLASFSTPGQSPGPAPIPEPSTLLLLGSGIVGMGTMARRRNRRK